MERYDADKAARVWQRVRGEGENTLTGVFGMAAAEQSAAEMFRQMQQQNPQIRAEDLVKECAVNAAVLRGIARLMGQKAEPIPSTPLPRELLESSLRRCYAGALQMYSTYEKYVEHPEYGPVFQELVQRKRNHCFRIPELLGKQPRQRSNR